MHTETQSAALQVMPGTASAGTLLMNDSSMDKLERLADLMASGRATVPGHLKGSKGDCFAICLQSMQWGMNPFAVAQKTHLINGTLGYEAQLVAAVINNSGLLKERLKFEWSGPWEKIIGKFKQVESRTKKDDNGLPKKYIVPDWNIADEQGLKVKVWATLKGESQPRVLELLLTQARTRNSTLWTEDPKQQLAYLAEKRWARLHTPDVILGVYTPDELHQPGEHFMGMADVVEPGDGAPAPTETASQVEPPAKAESFYPQADFEKNLPQWVNVVTSGRKTLDAMLTFVQSKAKLSPEQIKTFTDAAGQAQANTVDVQAKVVPGGPAVNPETLLAEMQAASTCDQLYERAALIDAVPDAEQRKRLSDAFDARNNELKEQQ